MRLSQTGHTSLITLQCIHLMISGMCLVATGDARFEAAADFRCQAGRLKIPPQPLRRFPKHDVAPAVGGIKLAAVLVAIEGEL